MTLQPIAAKYPQAAASFRPCFSYPINQPSQSSLLKFLSISLLLLFAASTAFSQTLIYSIKDGRWSDPATWWGNQVPNCDYVVVKHSVLLDQNLGAACGGSKWVRVEDTGTLTIDNSQPRTLAFASTGADPIGSGSSSNPGADASMFGFVVSGVLDLEGTPQNWITITSFDDSSPVYLHHQAQDWIGCTAIVNNVCNGHSAINGASLKMRYVNARHLGAPVKYYEGIGWDMRSGTSPANSLDIAYSQFTDLNQITHYDAVLSAGIYNFSQNTVVGPRQTSSILVSSYEAANGWVITDNTETGALVEGAFADFVASPTNLTFSRNAALGTADVQRGVLDFRGGWSGGGTLISNNLCYNPEPNYDSGAKCIFFTGLPSNTSQITGNVLFGSLQPLAILGGSPQITYNWLDEFETAAAGQGDIIVYGMAATPYVAYNIHLLESDDNNILSLLISDGGNNFLSAQLEHNTYVGMGLSSSLFMGEGTDPELAVYNSYARDNLIVGGNWGIVDGNPNNTWNPDNSYNGAGVHHNDVFNVTIPYMHAFPPSKGFDDGIHPHPDGRYGDVTADPFFLDRTRRPTDFDRFLGGPGTMDHFFAQLALRNQFGGNYDARYNVPSLLTWLRAGFIPQNLALRGKAHDGKDIGAMPVILPSVFSHN
jgi:hypothetical protein